MTAPSPSRSQQEQLDRYIAAMAAYQTATVTLRATLTTVVTRLWRQLGTYRQADMARFVRQVVPIVTGGQQTMLSLTAANLAQQRAIALGGPLRPVAVNPRTVTGSQGRGIDPRQVYERPFHLVWRQLHDLPHEPGSIDQAIQSGLDRAVELALDDLQVTKQRTARQVLAGDERVVGYRRVLEGTYSCGLCIVAATLRYTRGDLLPIHGACDCSVNAIYGDADPGLTVAAHVRAGDRLIPVGDLADIHDRIEQRFGSSSSTARSTRGVPNYRDVLVTHDHGELGPVLAVRGADHKTLAELKRESAQSAA